MPTTTRTRTSARPTPRFNRAAPQPNRFRGRRPEPPKSGKQRAIEGVAGALPGLLAGGGKGKSKSKSRSKAGGRSGKAGGAALLTAAAGLAFRNRGKLSSLLHRGSDAGPESSTVEAGTRPVVGTTAPERTGDIAPTDPGNRPDIPR
jgi:hypothetical protein